MHDLKQKKDTNKNVIIFTQLGVLQLFVLHVLLLQRKSHSTRMHLGNMSGYIKTIEILQCNLQKPDTDCIITSFWYFKNIFLSSQSVSLAVSVHLTPCECKYSTVLVNVQMMSEASFSIKFGTVNTLSSSSSPLSKSCTRNTVWPSSNTYR